MSALDRSVGGDVSSHESLSSEGIVIGSDSALVEELCWLRVESSSWHSRHSKRYIESLICALSTLKFLMSAQLKVLMPSVIEYSSSKSSITSRCWILRSFKPIASVLATIDRLMNLSLSPRDVASFGISGNTSGLFAAVA